MSEPLGRPTDYDPKYCQMIIEHFSIPPYREVMKNVVSNGTVVQIQVTEANDFPSFAGFAAKIGTHRETMRSWCDRSEDFHGAYKKAKELQENWLLVNGNKSLVNTAFGIFTAKNVLGYRDKQADEVPTIVQNQITIPDEQLARVISGAKDKPK